MRISLQLEHMFDSVFDMGHPRDAYAALGGAVTAARKSFDVLAQVTDAELSELVVENHRRQAHLKALELELLCEAKRRDLPHRCGAVSPGAWLSGLVTMDPRAAAKADRTAAVLDTACAETKAALAEG